MDNQLQNFIKCTSKVVLNPPYFQQTNESFFISFRGVYNKDIWWNCVVITPGECFNILPFVSQIYYTGCRSLRMKRFLLGWMLIDRTSLSHLFIIEHQASYLPLQIYDGASSNKFGSFYADNKVIACHLIMNTKNLADYTNVKSRGCWCW